MADNNDGGQPNKIYGFKANFRQRKTEVELRIDKVDRFNIPYTIIPKRLILSAVMAAVLIITAGFFLLIDLRRTIYIGIPILLMVISLLILIGLYAFYSQLLGHYLKSVSIL